MNAFQIWKSFRKHVWSSFFWEISAKIHLCKEQFKFPEHIFKTKFFPSDFLHLSRFVEECRQKKKTEEAKAPIQLLHLITQKQVQVQKTGRNTHRTQGNIYNDRQ